MNLIWIKYGYCITSEDLGCRFYFILFIYLSFLHFGAWLALSPFTYIMWSTLASTFVNIYPSVLHMSVWNNTRWECFFEWTVSLNLHSSKISILELLNRWSASCRRVCLSNMGRGLWQHNTSGKPFSYHALLKIWLALLFSWHIFKCCGHFNKIPII